MPLSLSSTLRTTRASAIASAAGTSALISFYSGTRPATGGTATTLLATVVGDATAFGSASAGVLTLNTITQPNTASYTAGTPTWVRISTSASAFVADLSISDMTWAGTIATGVAITFGALTITEGNA